MIVSKQDLPVEEEILGLSIDYRNLVTFINKKSH